MSVFLQQGWAMQKYFCMHIMTDAHALNKSA